MQALGFYHGKCTVSCRKKCNFKYYFLEICVVKRAEMLVKILRHSMEKCPRECTTLKFFRFEISFVTFTATTLGNAILVRPLFTIKNNKLNDFFFVCASCPLVSASQTVLRIKFSTRFVSNSANYDPYGKNSNYKLNLIYRDVL